MFSILPIVNKFQEVKLGVREKVTHDKDTNKTAITQLERQRVNRRAFLFFGPNILPFEPSCLSHWIHEYLVKWNGTAVQTLCLHQVQADRGRESHGDCVDGRR